MRGVFSEQRREVVENIVGLGSTVTQAQLFDIQVWTDELIEVGKPIYVAAIADIGSEVLNELVADATLNMDAKPVVKFVDKFAKKYAKETNKVTVDLLKTSLQEGIRDGEGIPKLTGRVNDVFDFNDKVRAERIARSETIRASNFGAEEAMVQSGVVEGKEWLTAMDDRTCPFCESMDGKVVDLGESYFGQGDSLTVPGDNGPLRLNFNYAEIAYPPLHPNCRCTLIPVVIDT